MSMPPTLPPQGWYPDPEAPGQQRWWDGQAWGPKAPPTAPSAPSAGPGGFLGQIERQVTGAAADPGGYYHQHEKGINEAGGAALLAEGLGVMPHIGPRRSNGGPVSALIGIVVGIIFVAVGFFMLGAAKPQPVRLQRP